ncbi:MAG: hypothetical protein RIS33_811, partial [Actinomycetota bacterium]
RCVANRRDERSDRLRVLDVDAEVVVAGTGVDHLGNRRDVSRKIDSAHRADRHLASPAPDETVVIENGHPVGGDPDIGLESGGTEAEGQLERLDRVLVGVGPGSPVGEPDRGIQP